MRLANPPKALIALVALMCITGLLLANRISEEAGLGLMGLIIGYAIGNGIAAKQGDPIQPIFDARDPHRRQSDKEENHHHD